MSLSCECDFDVSKDWHYYPPTEYLEMPKYSRRKKCCSCGEFICAGDLCTEFCRYRPATEWEDINLGEDEIELAPWHMCEECSDLYFSLAELGFCIFLGGADGNMKELVKEYAKGDWR